MVSIVSRISQEYMYLADLIFVNDTDNFVESIMEEKVQEYFQGAAIK